MTSIEFVKYLLFYGYITYSDFRRVSHYGLKRLTNIDENQEEFMNLLSGAFEYTLLSKNDKGCDFSERKSFSHETLVSNATYQILRINSMLFSNSTV